jgi:hypothetical protein
MPALAAEEMKRCYRFPMKKIVLALAALLALSFIALAVIFVLLFHHK